MKKLISVTIGDDEGIGIKLLLKEWENKKINNFILISNYNIFHRLNLIKKSRVNIIENYNEITKFNKNKFNILNFKTKNRHTNTLESLKLAYHLTDKKYFIGILTLPLDKKNINTYASKKFIDQTTFFSKFQNVIDSNMVFMFKKKFFIPMTTHIEIKNVYKYFKNKNLIINKIINIKKTLVKDFKIINPKLIISGINPHAGEQGLISKDDNKYLNPIITDLRKKMVDINGPISGDAIVNKVNLKNYDAFIFTYHDQALIPFKLISNLEGINFTSNLNIIRVSPSHGTAKNITDIKYANSKSILNSFKAIKSINKNRSLS